MITSVSLNHYVSTNRLDFLSRLSRGWVCVCVVFAGGMPVGRQFCGVKLGRGCCLLSPHPDVLGGGRHAGGFCGGQFVHFVRFGVDSHSLSVFILVIILHMQF